MSDKIVIFDTTLRDGEQAAGVHFTQRDKVEIAEALAGMRVDVIEAGFPAASRAELECVRAVAEAVREPVICALARAVERDIDAAARALERARRKRIHVFINASDTHIVHQLRKDRDSVLAIASAMVQRARNSTDDVEFTPMDATRADPAFLAEIVRVALTAGASTINFPDTVGCARPTQIATKLRALRAAVPELENAVLSFHGQDDLGLATANAIAAIEAGARQVELAVNGIGERAGNTPFEEVVMALRLHGPELDVFTDVDTTCIHALSGLVEDRSRITVPPNKAIVGANAFRHASGIHQDGVIKHRATYEAIDPAWIGHPHGTEIVLGKLSGRAGFLARVNALGIDLATECRDAAFDAFQTLADSGSVTDRDIRRICDDASSLSATLAH